MVVAQRTSARFAAVLRVEDEARRPDGDEALPREGGLIGRVVEDVAAIDLDPELHRLRRVGRRGGSLTATLSLARAPAPRASTKLRNAAGLVQPRASRGGVGGGIEQVGRGAGERLRVAERAEAREGERASDDGKPLARRRPILDDPGCFGDALADPAEERAKIELFAGQRERGDRVGIEPVGRDDHVAASEDLEPDLRRLRRERAASLRLEEQAIADELGLRREDGGLRVTLARERLRLLRLGGLHRVAELAERGPIDGGLTRLALVVGEPFGEERERRVDPVEPEVGVALAGEAKVLGSVGRRVAGLGVLREHARRPLVGEIDDGQPELVGVVDADRSVLAARLEDGDRLAVVARAFPLARRCGLRARGGSCARRGAGLREARRRRRRCLGGARRGHRRRGARLGLRSSVASAGRERDRGHRHENTRSHPGNDVEIVSSPAVARQNAG